VVPRHETADERGVLVETVRFAVTRRRADDNEEQRQEQE
jgi:hypothetical protein